MGEPFVPGIATEGGAETELHAAAWEGNADEIVYLVEAGASVNAVDSAGETALHGAAAWGRVDAVSALTRRGADVSIAETAGLTALHWAASHGNLETVQVLLDAGADAAAKDVRELTPEDLARKRAAQRSWACYANIAESDVAASRSLDAAQRNRDIC